LHRNDQRRLEAELVLRNERRGQKRRDAYAEAIRLGYEIKDTRHGQLRSFRNIVYGTTMVLTVTVVVLCVIGATFPDAIPSASRRRRPPPPRPSRTGRPTGSARSARRRRSRRPPTSRRPGASRPPAT
jgi:hypothetical protein